MRKLILAPFLVAGLLLLALWVWPNEDQSRGESQVEVLLPPNRIIPKPLSYIDYKITAWDYTNDLEYGDCPDWFLYGSAMDYKLNPNQDFDQRFLDIFYSYDPLVRFPDGKLVRVLEIGGVCLFEHDGLIFGDPGSYDILVDWFEPRNIPKRNVCEIIWVQCPEDSPIAPDTSPTGDPQTVGRLFHWLTKKDSKCFNTISV